MCTNNIDFTQIIDGQTYCELGEKDIPAYHISENGKYYKAFLNEDRYRVLGFVNDGMVIYDGFTNPILIPTNFILDDIFIYGDVDDYLNKYSDFISDKF